MCSKQKSNRESCSLVMIMIRVIRELCASSRVAVIALLSLWVINKLVIKNVAHNVSPMAEVDITRSPCGTQG
jgi:hypothetical protein